MKDHSNRPTESNGLTAAQKAHRASPWVALIGMIPALILAWQSSNTAASAKDDARERANDVSTRGLERDDRTWRYTRRVLDQQSDDIDACFDQLDEVSQALEALYEHVAERKPLRRLGRNTPRPVANQAASEVKPNWKRSPRYNKSSASQAKLPERLEDLQRLED